MSKPNLIGYKVSIGINENKRIMELQRGMAKAFPQVTVPFATHAQTLFEMMMAYAAANQVNGDFAGYTDEDFHTLIWAPKCLVKGIPMSLEIATKVRKFLRDGGLLEKDKIRSWMNFNKTIAEHQQTSRRNQRAGRRGAEAKALKQQLEIDALKGKKNGATPAPAAEQTTEYGPRPKRARVKGAKMQDTETHDRAVPGPREIEWNGKIWGQTQLQLVVEKMQAEVEAKTKELKNLRQVTTSSDNPKSAQYRLYSIHWGRCYPANARLYAPKYSCAVRSHEKSAFMAFCR